MMNPVQALFACCLLCAVPAFGAASSVNDIPFSEDHVLRTWDVTDGLRDNHISGIAQGRDGYLWVTNFSGLFRFDGSRFELMGKQTMPGLPSPWVAPVFAARDGTLWLGLERGGVARWSGGKLDTMVAIRPRPTKELWPWSFAEEASDAVWCGMTDRARVLRFSPTGTRDFSDKDGIPAGGKTLVRVAADGRVWVATSGGIAVFDGHRFRSVDPEAGGGDRLTLAPSAKGGVWTIREGALLRYDNEGRRLEAIAPPWLSEIGRINALLEDRAGALWIGTESAGLLCFKDGEFERERTSFGNISWLTEDRAGNLWVGTWGGGLDRLSPRRFFLRQTQDDSSNQALGSLYEDGEGGLWVLDYAGEPLRADSGKPRAFTPVAGWPSGVRARVLCPDGTGGVWLGTEAGLLHWTGGKLERTEFREAIVTMFAERGGAVCLATDTGGIYRLEGARCEKIGEIGSVCAMAEDAAGRLWAGTSHGDLFRWRNGSFERIFLPGAGADQEVRFIVPDRENTVWIGTLLGGLYRWRDGEVRRLTDVAGVSLAEVRSLLIERSEAGTATAEKNAPAGDVFWLGTATGLFRVDRAGLEACLDGGNPDLHLTACGSNDGLPDAEFVQGARHGAIEAKDGRLWFATNRGLVEVAPGAAAEPAVAPRVLIEEAKAGPVILRLGAGAGRLVFPPRPESVSIRYTLPELNTPEQVCFRYRFAARGEAGEWTDVGAQREVTIARPDAGRYHFEVEAAVADGAWLPPAGIEFAVLPAWWQTGAFRAGAVLALIAIAAGAARGVALRRMRGRIRRLEQEQAIDRERARIARDMHDELGANLTHIAATARLAALEPGKGHGPEPLREIETIVRQSMDSLDEIVWAVNPRNDTLAGTVEYAAKFAANFLAKAGIELELTASGELPARRVSAEQRHNLFLSVKEALNNVARHSGAKRVRMRVELAGETLEVGIEDDGRGFAAGDRGSFSNGLGNMGERMAKIGGRCRIESDRGTGCRVTLLLPLGDAIERENSL